MPQLDILAYMSELFWFLTFFFGLYLYISIRFTYALSGYQISKSIFLKDLKNVASTIHIENFNSNFSAVIKDMNSEFEQIDEVIQDGINEVIQDGIDEVGINCPLDAFIFAKNKNSELEVARIVVPQVYKVNLENFIYANNPIEQEMIEIGLFITQSMFQGYPIYFYGIQCDNLDEDELEKFKDIHIQQREMYEAIKWNAKARVYETVLNYALLAKASPNESRNFKDFFNPEFLPCEASYLDHRINEIFNFKCKSDIKTVVTDVVSEFLRKNDIMDFNEIAEIYEYFSNSHIFDEDNQFRVDYFNAIKPLINRHIELVSMVAINEDTLEDYQEDNNLIAYMFSISQATVIIDFENIFLSQEFEEDTIHEFRSDFLESIKCLIEQSLELKLEIRTRVINRIINRI